MNVKTTGSSFLCFLLVGIGPAFGSANSNGPNGINSTILSAIQGLTGDGIAIGQVEPGRPGQMGFDPPGMTHTAVNPTAIFRQDGPANLADADAHALQVAGVMISSDPGTLAGVSPDASLYASAYVTTGVSPGYEDALRTIQHVATQNGGDVRAINHSWGKPLGPGLVLDGNSLLTAGLDWTASQYDVLNVVAGNEGTMIPIPTDNFNGLTVGFSDRVGGVYRRVDSGNTFTEDAVGVRTSIDLIAPGEMIEMTDLGSVGTTAPHPSGTSFAAPHVTGTVALLQEHAENQITAGATNWNANARRHEVMKAVLMNSADKLEDTGDGNLLGMTRTVLKKNSTDTWLTSPAANDPDIPLDLEMGAGHLNANRALKQFRSGKQDSDGADVPVIGWDLGMTTGVNDENRYAIGQSLRAGSRLAITLTWDRIVDFDIDGGTSGVYDVGDTFETYTDLEDVVNDLNILLVRRGDDIFAEPIVASSEGNVSFGGGYNLEHLFFEIPTTEQYDIVIEHIDNGIAFPLGAQEYGISWWGVTNALLSSGDFNGDGRVDFSDLAQWTGDFGVNSHSDADGDGDSDGFDFLAWQRNIGTGVPLVATSQAVPEPSSCALLLTALVCFRLRRRTWNGFQTGASIVPKRVQR